MKRMKLVLALILALAMALSMLTACGNTSSEPGSDAAPTAAPESEAPGAPGEPSQDGDGNNPSGSSAADLPLVDELTTFTILAIANPNMSGYGYENPADWASYRELTERTNVGFEWVLEGFLTISEKYSILVAGNDLPDVVNGDYYSAGVAASVEDDVYWDLAPYLAEYAPDYYELIQQDGIRQELYSDDGYVVAFAEIAEKELPPNNGMILRGDLLEEQGLDLPVTYDDYTEVLTRFKNEYDMESPFFVADMEYDVFSAGFGVTSEDFCLDDKGNLIYSPITDAFKSYLTQFQEWYKAGLIYQDFYSIPNGEAINYRTERMSNGNSAITFMYCEWISNITLPDADATLIPGYIPRQTADQQIHITGGIDASIKTSSGWFVSTNCEEERMKLLCRLANYLYTDEGAILANYGIEGVTFEVQPDGSKWYTELITDNPDMTLTQSLIYNILYFCPCRADYTKYNISTLTTWKEFAELWGSSADNTYKVPTLSLTSAEEETYSKAKTDVDTYLDEIIIRFMVGAADIDAEWDTYLATLDSLGVQDMIDIYEAAYERYKNK